MRFHFLYFLIVVLFILAGCRFKQMATPSNIGFADFRKNEYIAIEPMDVDQLGLLFEAYQEFDEKGKTLPLKWRETSVILYHQRFNPLKTIEREEIRSALETIKASSILTFSSITDLNAKSESVIKYNSKSSGVIMMTAQERFNPNAKTYMEGKLSKDSNYKFSYLSALYQGIAFYETFNAVETTGSGGYATFMIGDNYYASNNRGTMIEGNIIFRLKTINIDELIAPLTDEELIVADNVLKDGGFEQGFTYWGTGQYESDIFKEGSGGFLPSYVPLPDGSFKVADVSGVIDSKIKRTGKNSFRIIMKSERADHIYGTLSQKIDDLRKNTEYIACFYVKAKDAGKGTFSITINKDWSNSVQIDEGTYEWRKFEHAFNTGNNTSIDFRIISTEPGTVWVDDISFKRNVSDKKHD